MGASLSPGRPQPRGRCLEAWVSFRLDGPSRYVMIAWRRGPAAFAWTSPAAGVMIAGAVREDCVAGLRYHQRA